MGTGIIITIGSVAVGTMVTEKLLNACGKSDMAQMVNISGFSLAGTMTLGVVITLIAKCKTLF